MKVLFLFGGLPHYFNTVLNRIQEETELDVLVIAPVNKGITLGSGVHETNQGINFKVIRLQEYKTWYGKPFFNQLYATIKAEKPDIIVSGWPYFLGFLFRPLMTLKLKRNGVKLFAREIPFTVPSFNESLKDFSTRCVDSQKSELMFRSKLVFLLHKWIRKLLYTFVFDKALVYIDEGVKILSSYGLSKDRITVTFNSPDTEKIAETIAEIKHDKLPIIRKPHRLIHVGRLVAWKRVDLLIRAINMLQIDFPDIELCIIGKGEEETKLKGLCTELELEAHIAFLGAVYEGKEQSLEFLKSGVYVLAGMGGLSINEAMAHSLPIICSVADGTEKHLVFEGINGFYFKDNDVDDLANAIRKMFASDMVNMGLQSRLIIENSINIQTVSEKFISSFLSEKQL